MGGEEMTGDDGFGGENSGDNEIIVGNADVTCGDDWGGVTKYEIDGVVKEMNHEMEKKSRLNWLKKTKKKKNWK